MPRWSTTACGETPPCSTAGTTWKPPGPWSTPSWMSGAPPRPPACRSTPPGAGAPRSRTACSNATAANGTLPDSCFPGVKSCRGAYVILAGDVGGTKCNLALFSERQGQLTPIFKQRFRSKDFATFDLIAKEFARVASAHLGDEKIRAAGFGIAGPVIS